MGIFDSFFGPSASPMAQEVAAGETVRVINATSSPAELRKLSGKFDGVNHPAVQQAFAIKYLMFGQQKESKVFALAGAKHGLKPGNEFYNKMSCDSIGQCLTLLLTQFELSYSQNTIAKATALAYVHLSKSIKMFGEKAYDSRRMRAVLLKDHEYEPAVTQFMLANFEGQFKEVLIIADLVKSAPGYASVSPDVVRESFASAANMQRALGDTTVAGKDADEYTLGELSELGDKRHQMYFSTIEEKFLKNNYNISVAELNSILA